MHDNGRVNALLPVLLLFSSGQVKPPPAYSWKELGKSAKPALQLPSFKHLPIVSASEARERKDSPTIRIYRYTYKGDFTKEIPKFQRIYPKSAGWVYEPSDGSGPAFFERMLAKGPVRRQAFLISPGRWVRKEGVKGNVTTKPTSDKWIKISYNEELAKK
jgi:hypothetical protein